MSRYTAVQLAFLEGRLNRRIVAGTAAHTEIVRSSQGITLRIAYFAPESLFVVDDWHRNDYGTRTWRVLAVRAIAPGQQGISVPFIRPGADVLADVRGPDRCAAFLAWLASKGDAVESIGADGLRAAGGFYCEAPLARIRPLKGARK